MKPEYAIWFYTHDEVSRFINFHAKLSKLLGVPVNNLYSTKQDWESMVIELINFELRKNKNSNENNIVKEEVIET